jgi:hypothetical protein
MRRILIVLGALVLALACALFVLTRALRHPLPEATPGPDGDELARKIAAQVGADAFDKLGTLRFTLGGSHHYLWDRRRGFMRYQSGDDEVLFDLVKMEGRAFRAGLELSGDEKKKLLDKGYAMFCNDSFWLNPLAKLFDAGTSRARVEVEGRPALLISYASGGVTPGDKYLWLLDDAGRPRAWRIFASVLKFVPGIEMGWEDWTDLDGAKIATTHRVLGLRVQPVSGLAAAERPELVEPGPDPFAGLAQRR